jgi:hypothetical protein
MINMELAVDKFKKDDYLVVEPGVIFSEYEIKKNLDALDAYGTLLPELVE